MMNILHLRKLGLNRGEVICPRLYDANSKAKLLRICLFVFFTSRSFSPNSLKVKEGVPGYTDHLKGISL